MAHSDDATKAWVSAIPTKNADENVIEWNCKYKYTLAVSGKADYVHIFNKNVIKNSKRISKYNIIIVDISPNYSPSEIMLAGEPYLIDYLENFDDYMKSENFNDLELIDNHVRIWYY